MEALLLKMLQAAVVRLVSERLFFGLIVSGMQYVSKKTENRLDDRLTKDVADALGRADLLQD